MVSSSPVYRVRQFQTRSAQLSNWDKCNRCGSLRSAHGADWACPVRPGRISAVIPLLVGSLLVTVGLILRLQIAAVQAPQQAALAAGAIVLGITLVVAGVIGARWPR
jgi:hypothetical protein